MHSRLGLPIAAAAIGAGTMQLPAALPEPLRDTATGEALQAIIDLDLDELVAIAPPPGFAQD
jgi:hypothetical protein